MKLINKINNQDAYVKAPPAKAYTLRALIIGSMAHGRTEIINPLMGADQVNVINCLRKLGINIDCEPDRIIVNGGDYKPVNGELNVGESGVGMNFLTAACCMTQSPVILTGAKRLTERPIKEVVNGMRQLGGQIDYQENDGFPPIKITGGGIKGGNARINGSITSQYFSSIVISSPFADSDVTLFCLDNMTEKPYFDISLQMMEYFGVKAINNGYKEIHISSGQVYKPCDIVIEGDYSSASFFFCAAAICSSRITVSGLNPLSKQGDRHILDLLESMGCRVSRSDNSVTLEGKPLKAITVDMGDVPDLVPPVAVAAAFANGTSRFLRVGHLRHKECNRLGVIVSELAKMGVKAEYDEDSLYVHGSSRVNGAQINPHNDHRIAMSFAAAGLTVPGVIIEDEMCVAKSFPDFWERFNVFYQ